MKKFIILALSLGLVACQTPVATAPVGGPLISVPVNNDPKVAAVQQFTASKCSYIVDAGKVVQLLGNFTEWGGIIDLTTNVGSAICETIRRAQPVAVQASLGDVPEAFAQLSSSAPIKVTIPRVHTKKERDPEKARRKIERAPPSLDGVKLQGRFVR
jgi:hypothetical protein